MRNLICLENRYIEMELSKYANLGLRAAYGLILNDLAGKNKNFFVGACDTSTSAGLDRFKNNYPNRYIEMGISEQNAIGVASGMALEGNAIFYQLLPFYRYELPNR